MAQKLKKISLTSSIIFAAGSLAAPALVLAADCTNTVNTECLQNNPLVKDLQLIVNFLSAGVGVIVTGVIIVGGNQYMAAGDNPQGVVAAKQRIYNGLLALVAFIFMFAFLQWLIPGGVFK